MERKPSMQRREGFYPAIVSHAFEERFQLFRPHGGKGVLLRCHGVGPISTIITEHLIDMIQHVSRCLEHCETK